MELGAAITLVMAIVGLIVVPYKLFKRWVWPYVRPFVIVKLSAAQLPVAVSRSQDGARQTEHTNRTDGQTDEASEANRWLERVRLDRTKTMLIDLLVYSDWQVGEIRSLLKGDSGATGKEIEAARQRLGKSPSAPYRTPIAGRPTDPRHYQDDPELVYEPPD